MISDKIVENFRIVKNRYDCYKVQKRVVIERNIMKFRFFRRIYWKDKMLLHSDQIIFDSDKDDKAKLRVEEFFNVLRKQDIERQRYEDTSYIESKEHKVYNMDLDKVEYNIITAHRKIKK